MFNDLILPISGRLGANLICRLPARLNLGPANTVDAQRWPTHEAIRHCTSFIWNKQSTKFSGFQFDFSLPH